MADDTFDRQQRDEQWGSTADDAAGARALALLLDTHTSLPGIIKSFDPATNTATVQPAIRAVFEDGPVDLPLLVDVPVVCLGGGNFVQTFPIQPDDEVVLIFSERAIDFWWDRGGVQEAAEHRLHDISDAFAIVGPRSRPRFLASYNPDAYELRTVDGSTVLRMEDDAVTIDGGAGGAEPMVKGETYLSSEDDVMGAIDTFAETVESTHTLVSTLPQAVAAINALGPAATLLRTAIATFRAGASSYRATKGKVL